MNATGTIKLLIVDDEELAREMVRQGFDGLDKYHVLEARDGEQALRIAREERPDVILLDIRMPGMNGFQVCRALRASSETASIKVIMVTGLDSDWHRGQARASGADDFAPKPSNPDELRRRVESILGAV